MKCNFSCRIFATPFLAFDFEDHLLLWFLFILQFHVKRILEPLTTVFWCFQFAVISGSLTDSKAFNFWLFFPEFLLSLAFLVQIWLTIITFACFLGYFFRLFRGCCFSGLFLERQADTHVFLVFLLIPFQRRFWFIFWVRRTHRVDHLSGLSNWIRRLVLIGGWGSFV